MIEGRSYILNKNINKPLQFFGLNAKWITLAAGILLLTFIVLTIMMVLGMPWYILLTGVIICGGLPIYGLIGINKKFGENGFAKFLASKNIPPLIKSSGRLKEMLQEDGQQIITGNNTDLFD